MSGEGLGTCLIIIVFFLFLIGYLSDWKIGGGGGGKSSSSDDDGIFGALGAFLLPIIGLVVVIGALAMLGSGGLGVSEVAVETASENSDNIVLFLWVVGLVIGLVIINKV